MLNHNTLVWMKFWAINVHLWMKMVFALVTQRRSARARVSSKLIFLKNPADPDYPFTISSSSATTTVIIPTTPSSTTASSSATTTTTGTTLSTLSTTSQLTTTTSTTGITTKKPTDFGFTRNQATDHAAPIGILPVFMICYFLKRLMLFRENNVHFWFIPISRTFRIKQLTHKNFTDDQIIKQISQK